MWNKRVSVDVEQRLAALEALRANVMLADSDLTITYANPAVMTLLKRAEADLVKDLPRFATATLIGSNIDVFHKNPQHQRGMLAKLETTHNATITVGPWMFDLIVTPLKDGPKHLGFVVEWADAKARLLNLDYAAQISAISRSHAVIEFTTDGNILEANSNFLKIVGYSIEEVQGKHHSIFVDAETRDSQAYKSFWDSLRRGEYYAAQFKRVAKNGKEVWVEGAYNPIVDSTGKVAKIVKFSTDITAERNLLANLRVRLSEIESAMSLSQSEAGSASEAATQTLNSVQTVATSAEQLASSIGEIASSMATSRTATERTAELTALLGESTESLADAAQAMNGIVSLIRNVASQINLLALNATIEAARAGEAGRGFAVVASEVKNLAIQAAKATERISTEIDGFQTTSTKVAGALGSIKDAVATVRENVSLTASAVEEQSAVTQVMSTSMQSAAASISTVGRNIDQISSAVREATGAVMRTREAAEVLVR